MIRNLHHSLGNVPGWILEVFGEGFDLSVLQLGGSRRLGGAREDSDWDFVYDYNEKSETWLLQNDFKDVFDFQYSTDFSPKDRASSLTVTVYERKDPRGTIQVNLVKDIRVYNKIVDIMLSSDLAKLHQSFDLNERILFWDTMAQLITPRVKEDVFQ